MPRGTAQGNFPRGFKISPGEAAQEKVGSEKFIEKERRESSPGGLEH